jgi:hypothetical protein
MLFSVDAWVLSCGDCARAILIRKRRQGRLGWGAYRDGDANGRRQTSGSCAARRIVMELDECEGVKMAADEGGNAVTPQLVPWTR